MGEGRRWRSGWRGGLLGEVRGVLRACRVESWDVVLWVKGLELRGAGGTIKYSSKLATSQMAVHESSPADMAGVVLGLG